MSKKKKYAYRFKLNPDYSVLRSPIELDVRLDRTSTKVAASKKFIFPLKKASPRRNIKGLTKKDRAQETPVALSEKKD